jgi:hypothetical protein
MLRCCQNCFQKRGENIVVSFVCRFHCLVATWLPSPGDSRHLIHRNHLAGESSRDSQMVLHLVGHWNRLAGESSRDCWTVLHFGHWHHLAGALTQIHGQKMPVQPRPPRPWRHWFDHGGGGHLQRRHRQLLRIHRNQTVDLIFQDHRASHGGIGAPCHNLEAFCFIMVGPSSGGAAEGMSLFVMVKVCKKALEKMWFPMK